MNSYKILVIAKILVVLLFAFVLAGIPEIALAQLDPNGKPAGMGTGSTVRYFLWKDGADNWHVRWTTAGKLHRFTGKIHCETCTFSDAFSVAKERRDWYKIGPKGHNIWFDTKVSGGMDGVDFRISGSGTITFNLQIDGKKQPNRVFVGSSGANPSAIPFTISQ